MADDVGPFRTKEKLLGAVKKIAALGRELGERPLGRAAAFDLQRLEWFDLRNMLLVAHAVAWSALLRAESRGAHQREDCPAMLPQWQLHKQVRLIGKRNRDYQCAGRGKNEGAGVMSQETKQETRA